MVAVIDFENRATVRWWGSGVGEELAGMLSNELAALGSFRLVERDKIRAVLDEQNLAASGRVAAGTGPAIGRLTGAQYLITGTVTAYDERSGGTGGGISFRGISLGGRQSRAYIAIDVRVIDANTGEVAYARTVEGTATSGGVEIGISRSGFGGALASEERTPAGQAIRAALDGGGGVPRVRHGRAGSLHPGVSREGAAAPRPDPQQAAALSAHSGGALGSRPRLPMGRPTALPRPRRRNAGRR
ncbi:MAG: CsgG/HfaB family protein [Xanthomonadales bacterium]|nr:CsgG/HfaB family protein [Xanthomonadales bacterium]